MPQETDQIQKFLAEDILGHETGKAYAISFDHQNAGGPNPHDRSYTLVFKGTDLEKTLAASRAMGYEPGRMRSNEEDSDNAHVELHQEGKEGLARLVSLEPYEGHVESARMTNPTADIPDPLPRVMYGLYVPIS